MERWARDDAYEPVTASAVCRVSNELECILHDPNIEQVLITACQCHSLMIHFCFVQTYDINLGHMMNTFLVFSFVAVYTRDASDTT